MVRVAIASAIAVVFASGVALAAPAATLSNVSGSVLVDSGKGFAKVSSNTAVAPGSRVLISKGANATLAYAEGCSKTLSANTITTVAGANACADKAQVAGQTVVSTKDQSLTWVYVGGGVVVGGLVGYWISQSSSGDTLVYVPIPTSL